MAGDSDKPETDGSRAAHACATHFEEIPLTAIDTTDRRYQFRLAESVGDLKRSLRAHGQRQPIDLNGNDPFRIVDGFRRVRAATELGWNTIGAFVHRNLGQREALRMAFAKNVVRKNLSALEKANAMYVAQEQGVEKKDLPDVFAISERQVARYLEVLTFPPPIQALLADETKPITMAHAKVLHDAGLEDVDAWAQRIACEKLDARTLKKIVRADDTRKRGRKPRYFQIDANAIRVRAFRARPDMPADDRLRLLEALRTALQTVESWGDPMTPSIRTKKKAPSRKRTSEKAPGGKRRVRT